MVKQYPHTLKATIQGAATTDVNGDVQPGTPTTFKGECRAELNTEGRTIRGVDGNEMAYSFTVFMPKTTTEFPYNTEVSITMDANRVVKGTAKGQSNGQLNTRLWV